ncbi:TetR/AcrR family transcriptional regulator [Actinoallomurus sp. NPDC050550]|uniref:TetR/AcrR family transcriptional regulator n=1 Tax=Actinoallomurus sp. NPDC050550 TaxID=3154937 RepID=UPI0033F6560B
MTSIRHKKDAMLDAARDCVLAVGVTRTTLTDVARRAGVSRMTIYRRWPDVRTLVADLMTREWAGVVAPVAPPADGGPVRPRAVDALVAGVAALREHPLFLKILEVDPEILLPYLLQRRGTSQDAMLRAFEKTLRAGHRDGTIRADDPTRQARAVLLIVQSFAMSGHIVTDGGPDLSPEAFDEELRQILERYLTP